MRKNQIILIIIGIIILIGLTSVFIYWLQYLKPEIEVSVPRAEELEKLKEEELTKFKLEQPEEAELPPGSSRKNITSCNNFPEILGELSCQEAKELALEEYLGEIYNIEKGGSEENKFWVIEIQQKEKKIEVFIDMEGNIIRTNI
jgi:hypothetical protein